MALSTRFSRTDSIFSFKAGALRRRVQVRAEEDKQSFFEANRLANKGYTEQDSAGQQNIFAVQPKKYAQGSSVDKTTGSAGNTFFGIAGAAVGAVVVIGGTAALFVKSAQDPSTSFEGDFSGLSTLSEYKAKFSSELKSGEAPSPMPESL